MWFVNCNHSVTSLNPEWLSIHFNLADTIVGSIHFNLADTIIGFDSFTCRNGHPDRIRRRIYHIKCATNCTWEKELKVEASISTFCNTQTLLSTTSTSERHHSPNSLAIITQTLTPNKNNLEPSNRTSKTGNRSPSNPTPPACTRFEHRTHPNSAREGDPEEEEQ